MAKICKHTKMERNYGKSLFNVSSHMIQELENLILLFLMFVYVYNMGWGDIEGGKHNAKMKKRAQAIVTHINGMSFGAGCQTCMLEFECICFKEHKHG